MNECHRDVDGFMQTFMEFQWVQYLLASAGQVKEAAKLASARAEKDGDGERGTRVVLDVQAIRPVIFFVHHVTSKSP